MLIGYNNDIEHRGMTFHIQTEDRGATDSSIETQLFQGGAILDTKITSYEEIVDGLEGEKRNKKIKSVMKASHRSLFKNLLAGKYDEQVGLEPLEKSDDELRDDFKDKVQDFQPGQDRVPQAAVELEEEGIDALEQEAQMEGFEDPADEDHMGLSKLKDRLEDIDKKEPADDEPEPDLGDVDISLGDSDSASQSKEPETSIIDPPSDVALADSQSESSTATKEQPSVTADTDKLDTVQVEPEELDTQRLEDIEASWSDSNPETDEKKEQSVDIAQTGTKAWKGCRQPDEDLSLVELVEAQLSS